jgi:hypothetical protein
MIIDVFDWYNVYNFHILLRINWVFIIKHTHTSHSVPFIQINNTIDNSVNCNKNIFIWKSCIVWCCCCCCFSVCQFVSLYIWQIRAFIITTQRSYFRAIKISNLHWKYKWTVTKLLRTKINGSICMWSLNWLMTSKIKHNVVGRVMNHFSISSLVYI